MFRVHSCCAEISARQGNAGKAVLGRHAGNGQLECHEEKNGLDRYFNTSRTQPTKMTHEINLDFTLARHGNSAN